MVQKVSALFQGEAVAPELVMETGLQSSVSADGVATLWTEGPCSHSSLSSSPPGAGILAMANAGPDTNGSQFFVTLAPTQWLDGKHTIFGRVCQGIGMVNRVGMVETNSQDRPVDDVKILKAYPSG